MQVTNGTVEYGRTVKPADFESKSARITLSFAVAEGSDAAPVVARVFDMVEAEVHRRLGIPAGMLTNRVTSTATEANLTVQEAAAKINGNMKRKLAEWEKPAPVVPQARPTSAETITEPSPDGAPSAAVVPASETDPAAIVEPVEVEAEVKPVVITDADMHAAVHQAIAAKVGAMAIRNLTAKYTGAVGKSMATIEPEQRADFLRELRALHQ